MQQISRHYPEGVAELRVEIFEIDEARPSEDAPASAVSPSAAFEDGVAAFRASIDLEARSRADRDVLRMLGSGELDERYTTERDLERHRAKLSMRHRRLLVREVVRTLG